MASSIRESESAPVRVKPMRLRRNLSLGIGGTLVAILILIGIFGPLIAHRDPLAIDLRLALARPTSSHPLGCDSLGRDMLARLIFGARLSLAVSMSVVALSLIVGSVIGGSAALAGGRVD